MITFLKLGGSVITDKSGDSIARRDTIRRIAAEITESRRAQPAMRLILGHGSGSFGHTAAAKYGTRKGAFSPKDWQGAVEVWMAARELNSIVLETLAAEGLPAVAFPPSATAISDNGKLISMAIGPIQHALDAGLLPVVYGDVVFDQQIGTSIASTEEVFTLLSGSIKPERLLLAGRAEGVYSLGSDPPELIPEITPGLRSKLQFKPPEGDDVTGGMASKVDLCLELAKAHPGLEILIFSADVPGELQKVLAGAQSGTKIRA